ncbi:MAG: hypothetical protein QJR03_04300 [Sphaerobacter sp.]|nr:hypothetical protein [Sphaerobacter sp.]
MLYRFLSGDFPITIVLYLVTWLWARGRPSLLRQVALGDTPVWNGIGRLTLAAVGLFPLWVALADNWRQLMAYGMVPSRRWESNPFATAVTAEPVRAVTLALLAVGLVGTALLCARHRASLPVALLAGALGVVGFYFLNPIRIRLDVYLLGTEASLAQPRVVDVGFIVFWASGLYCLIAGLIVGGAAALFAAVALPVRLGYWLISRGRPEREAPVFQVFHRRAQALHAAPLPAEEPRPPAEPGGGA